jgi:hypothetical protein
MIRFDAFAHAQQEAKQEPAHRHCGTPAARAWLRMR